MAPRKGAAAARFQEPTLQVVRGQGGKARKATPRSRQLANMPSDQIICRVLVSNHSIDPNSYEMYAAPGGGTVTVFSCAVCGTEITKYRDRHGFLERNNGYKYPKGYEMEEGGRLSADEKAGQFLRLAGSKRR